MLNKPSFLAACVAVVMLAGCGPIRAQVWDRPGDRDRRWGQNDYSRQAYDNGYRRGSERGERDGRDGRPMNYRGERDYRSGDWGYNDRYGRRDDYRDAFRRGFEAGYSAGYNRFGRVGGRAVPRDGYGYPDDRRYPAPGDRRYGSGSGYAGDIAFRNGYEDGLEKGQKDGRGRKGYDVLRHDWYRDGDHHYKREYGPRDLYRDAYRSGFKQGYDQAYGGRR
jgi:hypothetical protein